MDALVLAQEEAIGAGFLLVFGLFYLAFIILFIAAAWKIFTKAGEDGWKVLVPIYNLYTFCQIAGRPGWWVLLFFVPFVNVVVQIILAIDIAKSFGKDTAFAVGLVLLSPIFYPILAFGDARYLGPAGPEPRPGYQSLGQGGYGAPGQYGAPQGGYQPPPGQQWGQAPAPAGEQWGQAPAQQWGAPPAQQWGQAPAQPDQQWGQAPAQPDQQWGQAPAQPDQQWGQAPGQPDQQWGQPPAAQPPPSDQGSGRDQPSQPEQASGWGQQAGWGQPSGPPAGDDQTGR